MTHPSQRLDPLVHQPARLGILAILAEAQRADFSYLRDTLELTDGNLARHLQVLEEAGYVTADKSFEGRRARTWVSVSPLGREAFEGEIDTLAELVSRARPPTEDAYE